MMSRLSMFHTKLMIILFLKQVQLLEEIQICHRLKLELLTEIIIKYKYLIFFCHFNMLTIEIASAFLVLI